MTSGARKGRGQPDVPDLPDQPDLPHLPDQPDLPHLPDQPDLPHLPDQPDLSDPRIPRVRRPAPRPRR